MIHEALFSVATPTISWNVRDYGATHPLSGAQIEQLIVAFGLPNDKLEKLAPSLAHALNPRTKPRDLRGPRASEKRGGAAFAKALIEMESAEKKLEQALKTLQTIHFFHPSDFPASSTRSDALVEKFDRSCQLVSAIRRLLNKNADLSTYAYYRGVADKRLEKDHRRSMVCTALLRIWVASGRNLSITTHNETSARSGALVDFVNTVVGMVTTPAARINGETLRVEIDRYKVLFKQEREMKEHRTLL